MRLNRIVSALFIAPVLAHLNVSAQENFRLRPPTSQMVQGGTGLIQVPTSRMQEPGSLSINYTDNDQYRFWSVSMQLFPWMEATARYTDVRTQLYSPDPNFSGDQTLKDKGVDVKFRLWEESYYLPEMSVGFRDFGGTGFFESEFVSFSKAAGPFDFHLGMGWGYLGTSGNIRNPFCEVRDSFCERPTGFGGEGGKIDYNQFFKGPASVIGGLVYQTPWEPLVLKAEYEGNNYINDRAGELEQDSRWNFGAVYNYGNFDFSLNYQRGNTIGFGITYKLNLDTMSQVKNVSEPRQLMGTTPPESIDEINKSRLFNDLARQGGFVLNDTIIEDDKLVFYGNQTAYRDQAEAIDRVGRIIASEVPESIKEYHLVENSGVEPMVDNIIDADAFKAYANYQVLEPNLDSTYVRQSPSSELLERYEPARESGFFYNTNLFWTQTFGSPEEFFLYQSGLVFSTGYAFNKNYGIFGSARLTLLENFDKFNFTVDNEEVSLPRVRTYVREYVTRSDFTADTLYARWFDRLSDNWYAQAYAGYLETMYGGVGGEVLYRPVDSRFAFGVDLNYVKQRSFESDFGFRDYDVVTGHATAYWRPEFLPDAQLSVGVGQFLAGDKGVNIDFAKRFDSGVIVGAFAALTNVSAEEYGEGSFTKGFYISIPFDLFVTTPAKGRGNIPWIPIARDGGQPLQRPITLMGVTEVVSPFYD